MCIFITYTLHNSSASAMTLNPRFSNDVPVVEGIVCRLCKHDRGICLPRCTLLGVFGYRLGFIFCFVQYQISFKALNLPQQQPYCSYIV